MKKIITIKLRGKDYSQTSTRTEEFRTECPEKLEKKIKKKYDFEHVKGYTTMTEWLEIKNFLANK